MSFDIESLDAPGATGSYDSDFASKAAVATDALVNGGFDFAMVHVKAVDDTGHDRMLAMKVSVECQMPSLSSGVWLCCAHHAPEVAAASFYMQCVLKCGMCVPAECPVLLLFVLNSRPLECEQPQRR